MTRASEIKSIDCTSCGAGLKILGGGRVTTHICSYCGTELDVLDDYKALSKFANLHRPQSPFEIGMSGQLQGVEFTIIGTLGYREAYGGQVWEWVDHPVFSATHGYAYLTVEDGHLIFTRKYRKATSPEWLSSEAVELFENRPVVRSNYERFEYYDTSTSKITFAEGEFNWRPSIGDQVTTVSVLSDQSMLGFSQTATEREVERSTYLPQRETLDSFGVDDEVAMSGIHPLQPYIAGKNAAFLTVVGAAFMVLCLVMTVFFLGQTGSTVLTRTSFDISELPKEVTFEIKEVGKLAKMTVSGDVENSWAYLEMTLSDPDDQPLFQVGREIGYYTGYSSDGRWSEGSRRASLTFRPEVVGVYTVELELSEMGTWKRSGAALSRVTIGASAGVSSFFWTILLAGIFLIITGMQVGRKFLHQKRRMAGSDWTEEDDD